LSVLFLDEGLDDVAYNYVAITIKKSELSTIEAATVLWQELYSALEINLIAYDGIPGGITDEWLLENISICKETSAIKGDSFALRTIRERWSKVNSLISGKNA
jgi:hypothetical protein